MQPPEKWLAWLCQPAKLLVYLPIMLTTHVDSMLDYLYRNCIALILLSFDEGFGIPIIEAAFRSKKIILSDIEIFNEIAPRHSLKLNLNYKFTHLKLLHNYLKNEISIDLQSIVEKWSWDKSSLKLRKMLLLKLKEYT